MTEEVVIDKEHNMQEVMKHPKVKEALVKVLERKLREPLARKIAEGWEQVRKGTKCVYPNCTKKAKQANFHGYPLCEEHHDLSQWIGIIIFDDVYDDETHEDNLATRVSAIENWLKLFTVGHFK